MRIADLMTSDPLTLNSEATASTAAKIMRDHDLGSLPVVEADRLIGFVTDRDVVVRCVANDRDSTRTAVKDVMSPDIFCCRADQTPAEVMDLMSLHRVSRMPVVDDRERLVGIVTLGRIAESSGEPDAVCATISAVRQKGEA